MKERRGSGMRKGREGEGSGGGGGEEGEEGLSGRLFDHKQLKLFFPLI